MAVTALLWGVVYEGVMRIVVLLGGCALALTACGGSGSHGGSSSPYGPKSSPVALSRCMRANGVPSFPDPSEGPGGGGVGFPGGLGVGSNGSLFVDGSVIAGPAATNAEKACKEYLPPAGPPPALSERQKLAALAHARCMRSHGLPNFPDPTFPSGGGEIHLSLGRGLNPGSPAIQRAAKACGLQSP